MHRSKSAAAAALFTVLALLPLAAAPVAAGDPSASAKAEHQRIINYWTAERIASAKPRDFVRTSDGKFVPRAKPGGGTGASWTGGGTVVQRTGKVLFTMDGGNWVCSAAAVNDGRTTHSLIVTAGHCAYDEVNRAFATNWTYVPSFDTSPTFSCGQTSYGCWTATVASGGGLVVHNGYATAGGFNTQATVHDFAVAIVANGTNGTQLDALGTYGIAYPAFSQGTVHAFGYPAAGRYHGNDLTYCTGPTFNDQYNSNLTWGIKCNMTGGSSGGPWIAGFTGQTPTLTSLNSYGYSGLSNMYGPKFNSDTQDVYNKANTSVGNWIVP